MTRTCRCPVPFANAERWFSFDSLLGSIPYFVPGIFPNRFFVHAGGLGEKELSDTLKLAMVRSRRIDELTE